MKKNTVLKKILSSKSLSYLLILLLFFAVVSLGREINRQFRLQKEYAYLSEKTTLLQSENEQLLEELEKIQTDYFLEKAARTKLGLGKIGEEMIVIVSEDLEEKEVDANYFSRKISNFKTWWNYFFSPEKED
jgi:cell division protein FtsB